MRITMSVDWNKKYELAKQYVNQKKYKAAIKLLSQCISNGHVRSHFLLGIIYENGHHNEGNPDFKKAGESYLNAARATIPDAQAMINLGLLVSTKEYNDPQNHSAEYWFQCAINVTKETDIKCVATIHLVSYFYELDQYSKALECINKYWQQNDSEFYAWRAMLQEKLGRLDDAIRDMENAKRLRYEDADELLRKLNEKKQKVKNDAQQSTPAKLRFDNSISLGLTPYLQSARAKERYFEIKKERKQDKTKIELLSQTLEKINAQLESESSAYRQSEVEYLEKIRQLSGKSESDLAQLKEFQRQIELLEKTQTTLREKHQHEIISLTQQYLGELEKVRESYQQQDADIKSKLTAAEKQLSEYQEYYKRRLQRETQLKSRIVQLKQEKQQLVSRLEADKSTKDELEAALREKDQSVTNLTQLLQEKEAKFQEEKLAMLETFRKNRESLKVQLEILKQEITGLKTFFTEQENQFLIGCQSVVMQQTILMQAIFAKEEEIQKHKSECSIATEKISALEIQINQEDKAKQAFTRELETLKKSKEELSTKCEERIREFEKQSREKYQALSQLFEQEKTLRRQDNQRNSEKLAELESEKKRLKAQYDSAVAAKQQSDGVVLGLTITLKQHLGWIDELEGKAKQYQKQLREEIELHNQNIQELQARSSLMHEQNSVLEEEKKLLLAEVKRLKSDLEIQDDTVVTLERDELDQGEKNLRLQERIDEIKKETREKIEAQQAEILRINSEHSEELRKLNNKLEESERIFLAERKELEDTIVSLTSIDAESKKIVLELRRKLVAQEAAYSSLRLQFDQHKEDFSLSKIRIKELESEFAGVKKLLEAKPEEIKAIQEKYDSQLNELKRELVLEKQSCQALSLKIEQLQKSTNDLEQKLQEAKRLYREAKEKIISLATEQEIKNRAYEEILEKRFEETQTLETKLETIEREKEGLAKRYEQLAYNYFQSQNAQSVACQVLFEQQKQIAELERMVSKQKDTEGKNQAMLDQLKKESNTLTSKIEQLEQQIDENEYEYVCDLEFMNAIYRRLLDSETQAHQQKLNELNYKLAGAQSALKSSQAGNEKDSETIASLKLLVQEREDEIKKLRENHDQQINKLRDREYILQSQNEKLGELLQERLIEVLKAKAKYISYKFEQEQKVEELTDNVKALEKTILESEVQARNTIEQLQVTHRAELELLFQEKNTLVSKFTLECEKRTSDQKAFEEERDRLYVQLEDKNITRQELEKLTKEYDELKEQYACQQETQNSEITTLQNELTELRNDKTQLTSRLESLQMTHQTLIEKHQNQLITLDTASAAREKVLSKQLADEKAKSETIVREKTVLVETLKRLEDQYTLEKTDLMGLLEIKTKEMVDVQKELDAQHSQSEKLVGEKEDLRLEKDRLQTQHQLLAEQLKFLEETHQQALIDHETQVAKLTQEKEDALREELSLYATERNTLQSMITKQEKELEALHIENETVLSDKGQEIQRLRDELAGEAESKGELMTQLNEKEKALSELTKEKTQSEKNLNDEIRVLKQKQIEELETVRKELQAQKDSFEQDKKRIQGELEALQSKFKKAENAFKAKETEWLKQLDNHAMTKDQLSSLMLNFQQEKQKHEDEKAQFEQKVVLFHQELSGIKTSKQTIEKELSQLRSTQTALNLRYAKSIKDLKTAYAAKEQELLDKLTAEQKKVLALEVEKKQLQTKQVAHNKEQTAALSKLQEKIKAKEIEIESVQKNLAELSGDNQTLSSQLEQLTITYELLVKQFNCLNEEDEALRKNHANALERLEREKQEALKGQQAIYDGELKELKNVLKLLQAQYDNDMATLRTQLTAKTEELSTLLSTQGITNESHQKEANALNAKIIELNKQYQAFADQMKAWKEKSQKQHTDDIDQWKGRVKKQKQEMGDAKAQLNKKTSEYDVLQQELYDVRQQAETDRKAFQVETERLQNKINEIAASYEKIASTNARLSAQLENLKETDANYQALIKTKESLDETLQTLNKEKQDLEKVIQAQEVQKLKFDKTIQEKETAHQLEIARQQDLFEKAKNNFEVESAALQSALDTIKTEKVSIETEFKQYKETQALRISQLEQFLRDNKTESDALKLKALHNTQKIKEIEVQKSTLENQLSKVRSSLSEKEQECTNKLEEYQKKAQARVEYYRTSYEAKKSDLDEQLKVYRANKNNEIESLKRQLATAINDYEELKNKHVQTERRNSLLGRKNAEAELLQPQLDGLKEEKAQLSKRIKILQSDLESAQLELKRSSIKQAELEKTIRLQETEIDHLKLPTSKIDNIAENELPNEPQSDISKSAAALSLVGHFSPNRRQSDSPADTANSRRMSLRSSKNPLDQSSVSGTNAQERARRARQGLTRTGATYNPFAK